MKPAVVSKNILLLGIIVFTTLALIATLALVKKPQDIRERAAGNTVVEVLPAQATLGIGETKTFDIQATTGSNLLSAVDLVVNFDATRFTGVLIENGGFLPTTLTPGTITNGQARISVGNQMTSQGTGIVARLTLTATAATVTPILIEIDASSYAASANAEDRGTNVITGRIPSQVTIALVGGTTTTKTYPVLADNRDALSLIPEGSTQHMTQISGYSASEPYDYVGNESFQEETGIQFQLDIPKNATVQNAFVTVNAGQAFQSPSTTGKIAIRRYDIASAGAFTNGSGQISTKHPLYSQTIDWTAGSPWSAGSSHQTPEIKSLVQSYLARNDYALNNYIGFVFTKGTLETDRVYGWGDFAAQTPEATLTVTYWTPGVNPSPLPSVTPSPTLVPTPTPNPSPSPTLLPTPSPTLVPTPSPTLIPTPLPTPSATPTPAPLMTFKVKFEGVSVNRPIGAIHVAYKNGTVTVFEHDLPVTHELNGIYTTAQTTLSSVPAGTYDIYIKGPIHLNRKFSAQVVNTGVNTFDFSAVALLVGDTAPTVANNRVDIFDHNEQVGYFGCRSSVTPLPSPPAGTCPPLANLYQYGDLNYDQKIDIFDHNFKVGNFGKIGD